MLDVRIVFVVTLVIFILFYSICSIIKERTKKKKSKSFGIVVGYENDSEDSPITPALKVKVPEINENYTYLCSPKKSKNLYKEDYPLNASVEINIIRTPQQYPFIEIYLIEKR